MDSSEDMEKEYEPIIKIDYSKGAPSNRVSLMWEIKEELDKNSAAVSKAELDGTASREKVEFKNRDSTNAEEHQVKSEPPENEADSVELRKQWLSYNSKEELKTDRDVGDKSIGAAINEGIAANQSTSVGGQPLNFICSDDSSSENSTPCEVMLNDAATKTILFADGPSDQLPVVLTKNVSTDQRTLFSLMDGQYQCDVCDKRFSKRCEMARHIRTHTKEKPFLCEMCNKTFAQKAHLNLHMQTHTDEKAHKCEMCDKKYSQQCALLRHIRTHTNDWLFHCEICNKGFVQKSDLTRHRRTHTKEKPYECDKCDKRFVQKGHLTMHVRTAHNNIWPHYCTVCKKGFIQRSDMVRHVRTHTNEKPYECEVCGKRCTEKSNLVVHRKRHFGEKDHHCQMCDKAFIQKSDLNRHLTTHTILGL